jgi:hypothetical protein
MTSTARPIYPRTLWFETESGDVETVRQTDLPAKAQSIVVLGSTSSMRCLT